MHAIPFPIPHMGQQPNDDVAAALSLLNVISYVFQESPKGLDGRVLKDLFVVLDEARNLLKPVERYLNELDYEGILDDYRAARRDLIRECYEPFAGDEKNARRMTGGAR